MRISTSAQMRQIDLLTSRRYGVTSLQLMENAGAAVAQFALLHFPDAQKIGVVCGKGNNGGDGLAAARKLHLAGREVQVLLLADPSQLQGDAAEMLKRLPLAAVCIREERDLEDSHAENVFESDLLIDAILGTGFRPPVGELFQAAIHKLSSASKTGSLVKVPVLSVDIPSGVESDQASTGTQRPHDGPSARSSAIVTFTAPKPAHVFQVLTRGPVAVMPIGSPSEAIEATIKTGAQVITARAFDRVLQPRSPGANKGDFGHVLLIGGSLGKAGAPAMAGIAALRSGAGLVTVAVPLSVQSTVAGFAPEIMTESMLETDAGTVAVNALDYGKLEKLLQGKNVVAVGPGISRHPESAGFVRALLAWLKEASIPTVLDADGLNAFEDCPELLSGEPGGEGKNWPLVITPHPGEMARLSGLTVTHIQENRIAVAEAFAVQHQCVVVLKGHRTLISFPAALAEAQQSSETQNALPKVMTWVNLTGNPGMATGGTGDILTGIVAGMIAQHVNHLEDAVKAAVYLHGSAGDIARRSTGEASLIASDLLSALPQSFAEVHHDLESDVVYLQRS